MQEVGRPVFFSLLVITVAFLPVFTLEATEGRLFKPLAFTKTYSMGFAALLAVTLDAGAGRAVHPRPDPRRGGDTRSTAGSTALYAPVVRLRRAPPLAGGRARRRCSWRRPIPVVLRLGSEFMPPLNEGTLLYMPTAPPGIGEAEARARAPAMDRELEAVPRGRDACSARSGAPRRRPIPRRSRWSRRWCSSRPRTQWPKGMTWDGAGRASWTRKLQFPGMPNIWWMPIQTRTEMLATGVRSPLGIKVFGPDVREIERGGDRRSRRRCSRCRGRAARSPSASPAASTSTSTSTATRRPATASPSRTCEDVDRDRDRRHDRSPQTVEGRERYPVTVRYAREFRAASPSARAGAGARRRPARRSRSGRSPPSCRATGPPMMRGEGGRARRLRVRRHRAADRRLRGRRAQGGGRRA